MELNCLIMINNFYAHSTDSNQSDWQLLSDHLNTVSQLSAQFAQPFAAHDMAAVIGLLHDVGKYSSEFQRRLTGEYGRIDHSTAGAQIAVERYGSQLGCLLAYAIAGHHAGLANGRDAGERRNLKDRLAATVPELNSLWQNEIALPNAIQPPRLECPRKDRRGFQFAFLTRMLFSCLVDADFLDTEAFYSKIEGRQKDRSGLPRLADLQQPLDNYLTGFKADSPVNSLRAEILSHVRQQAGLSPSVFSLTVPTGGGKTLASLAFALDHALRYGQERIIYVIPFTSIIEQNAAVFRKALGELGQYAVLEHHSAFIDEKVKNRNRESREKLRLAMENWDAPIVVTTAVQFFESLFADRSSRCRKLHNIANSVIILDEAQMLPLKLLRPCVAALDELALNYRASVVLCTATQPALQETDDPGKSFSGGLRNMRELAPDPKRLYASLRRVSLQHSGVQDDAALAEHMQANEQILCIVNNRRHARALFELIRNYPGARHLTTLMCAKHRSQVLEEIRQRLKDGKPCRLVATSLIEAGVDVDFPRVLRAEAGLDSIAQAAGRCNREGRYAPESSEVRVFTAPDWPAPPELQQFAQVSREILRYYPDDPLSLQAIEAYFQQLYWQRDGRDSDLDKYALLQRFEAGIDGIPFESVARDFRMIETLQQPVIIPFDESARSTLRDLEYAERVGGIARSLQPYIVQLPTQGFMALEQSGAIQPIAEHRFGLQFMQLVNLDIYSDEFGLYWDEPSFIRAENTIW